MSGLGGKRTLGIESGRDSQAGAAAGAVMVDFEYLFSFYGLLLGLAVANVATGFADMWRDRTAVIVGVCAPLLACIVLFGGMNVWLVYWQTRQAVTIEAWRMLSAAGVALPYIFISRAMFPVASQVRSLEDHYLEHRQVILTALAVPPVVSAATNIILNGTEYEGWAAVWMLLRIGSPLVLVPFSSRVVQRVGLTAILVLLIVGLFR